MCDKNVDWTQWNDDGGLRDVIKGSGQWNQPGR